MVEIVDGRVHDIVHDIDEIADKPKAAKIWSEGDASLERLLLFLWSKGIKTRACCTHEKYIYFELNDIDSKFGAVLELARKNIAKIEFGDLENKNYKHLILVVREIPDKKVDNFFELVSDCFKNDVGFLGALKNYSPNGYKVFQEISKINPKLIPSHLGNTYLGFVCQNKGFGYENSISEDYVPINTYNKETIDFILDNIKERNDLWVKYYKDKENGPREITEEDKIEESLVHALQNAQDGVLVVPKEIRILPRLNNLAKKYGIATITFEPDSELYMVYGENFVENDMLQKIDFSNCKELETINLRSFFICKNLVEIIFPKTNKIKYAGPQAFAFTWIKEFKPNTSSLKDLKISALAYCPDLKVVDLSGCNNLETIGIKVFIGDNLDILDMSNCQKINSFDENYINTKILRLNYNLEGTTESKFCDSISDDCVVEVYDNGKKQFEFTKQDEIAKIKILSLSLLKFARKMGFDNLKPEILNVFENKNELKYALDNYDQITNFVKSVAGNEKYETTVWHLLRKLGYFGLQNSNLGKATKSDIEIYKNLLAKDYLKHNPPAELQAIKDKQKFYLEMQKTMNRLANKMPISKLVAEFVKNNIANDSDKSKLFYELDFCKYQKEVDINFAQFFVCNFKEIMDKKVRPIDTNEIVNLDYATQNNQNIRLYSIHNDFKALTKKISKKIVTRSDNDRLKLEDLEFKNIYSNVEPENKELAELCGSAHITQMFFDNIQTLFNEAKTLKNKQILQCSKDNSDSDWTYEIIEKDNPIGLVLGNMTNCCQKFGDRGQSCVIAGATNPNCTFVAFKHCGKIIGQSWVWYDKKTKTIALDNIEIPSIFRKLVNKEYPEQVENCLNRLFKNLHKTMSSNGHRIDNIIIGANRTEIDFIKDSYYKELLDDKMIKCNIMVDETPCYSDVIGKGQYIAYKNGKPYKETLAFEPTF